MNLEEVKKKLNEMMRMTKETQFDYDKENNSLFIFKKEAVKGSVDVGNYIVDFTHEGNVA